MATWLFVWLLLSGAITIVLIACLTALVRHAFILGRTARRFSEEVLSIAGDLSRQGARAQERASRRGSSRTPEGFSPGGSHGPRR